MRRALPSLIAVAVALALAAGCTERDGGEASEPPAPGEQQPPGEPPASGTNGEAGTAPDEGPLIVGWLFPEEADSDPTLTAVQEALGDRVELVPIEASSGDTGATAAEPAVADGATFLVDTVGTGACAANPELHCIEPATGEAPATNVAAFQPAFWNQEYLLGLTAGLSSESGTTGFIIPARAPQTNAAVNAWALGCQTANPNCLTRLIVLARTGGSAAEGAAELARAGVDVVRSLEADPAVCEVGGPAEPWLSPGYGCPERTLAEPTLDLAPLVIAELEAELDGAWTGGRTVAVALGEGAGIAWGSSAPANVQTEVEAVAERIAGGENVFVGPLFDNQGTERVAEGEELSEEFLASQWDWLLGGVLTG